MSDVVHGVCRGLPGERGPWKSPCTKRTFLFLPARICWRCLDKAQARVREAMKALYAEFEKEESEDGE